MERQSCSRNEKAKLYSHAVQRGIPVIQPAAGPISFSIAGLPFAPKQIGCTSVLRQRGAYFNRIGVSILNSARDGWRNIAISLIDRTSLGAEVKTCNGLISSDVRLSPDGMYDLKRKSNEVSEVFVTNRRQQTISQRLGQVILIITILPLVPAESSSLRATRLLRWLVARGRLVQLLLQLQ
jgi:hypothetical protein